MKADPDIVAAALPNPRLEALVGQMHMAHFTDPDQFVRHVDRGGPGGFGPGPRSGWVSYGWARTEYMSLCPVVGPACAKKARKSVPIEARPS
jgi:hypothetical protein